MQCARGDTCRLWDRFAIQYLQLEVTATMEARPIWISSLVAQWGPLKASYSSLVLGHVGRRGRSQRLGGLRECVDSASERRGDINGPSPKPHPHREGSSNKFFVEATRARAREAAQQVPCPLGTRAQCP